jgi:hypothetical protein
MSEPTRVQTYRGPTQQAAWDAYQRDAAEAARFGWVPVGHQWGADFLQVSYQPSAVPAPQPPAERAYASGTCPSCGAGLNPLPKAKKKCPSCGNPIFVRSGPDGLLYLLAEKDLAAHEATWEAHHEQLARQEGAQRNADLAANARKTLADCATYEIERVQVLGSDDGCPACRAFAGRTFRLSAAPSLPIPGCSGLACRCDYSPVVV